MLWGRLFGSLSRNKGGLRGDTYRSMEQQLSPGVSHLISGPEDTTVYLPALPCSCNTHPPSIYSNRRVCSDTFKVLLCCLGSARWFPDRHTERTGGHGKERMHFFRPGVWGDVCLWGGERRRGKRKETKKTIRGVIAWMWQISLWSSQGVGTVVDPARWWTMMDQRWAHQPLGAALH